MRMGSPQGGGMTRLAICLLLIDVQHDSQLQAGNERRLSLHETQPEPTPALAPGRWIDERYQL
jgi:hypothetical protein